jgi:hypothetical protein
MNTASLQMRLIEGIKVLAVALLFATVLAGCAAEPVYEGLRNRETLRNAPPDSVPRSGLPSYQDYEAERKKLLEPQTDERK